MNSSLERSRKIRTAGTYAFFIIGSIIMIFPFVWMFLTSFKTVEESMIIPPTILPAAWQIKTTPMQPHPCRFLHCIRTHS